MDADSTKGLCLFLLFVDTLFFGWLPYLLTRGEAKAEKSIRTRNLIISYLNCFAGGVFLGACLLHLLAEGREVMEEYFEAAGAHIEFPVYETAMAGGFFLIALIEQIAHRLLHNQGNPAKVECSTNTASGNGPNNSGTTGKDGLDNLAYVTGPSNGKKATNGKDMDHQDTLKKSSTPKIIHIGELAYGSTTRNVSNTEDAVTTFSAGNDVTNEEAGHKHNDDIVKVLQVIDLEANRLRAFLLLGALCFHTVFDGLAVGLQTHNSDVWEMFGAICIHKTLVAVSLGLQLFLVFKSKPIKAFAWIFFFALIAPVGVGLGMILTSVDIDELARSLVNWILQAISTGTFLYVTFFEILREELAEGGGILKLFVMVLGFGGMAVAKVLDAH